MKDELKILKLIFHLKNPTTQEIHTYLFSHLTRRSVELKLKHLIDEKMIDSHLLVSSSGARSPRYYTLLTKGAGEIGIEKVPSNKSQRLEFHLLRQAKTFLEYVSFQNGWTLLVDEELCQKALLQFLTQVSKARYGEDFPAYTLSSMLPEKFTDMILETGQEAIICILAHPNAESGYWRRKIEKYKSLITIARAICITLTEEQQEQCKRAATSMGFTRRLLVLPYTKIQDLPAKINPSNPTQKP